MPVSTHRDRVIARLPFELDLLDGDLEAELPLEMRQAKHLQWGLVVAAIRDSWAEEITLEGIDWKIILFPPGGFRVPRAAGTDLRRTRQKYIRRHCALLVVHTGESSVNRCRDVGRPLVRSLLGLVRRQLHMLLPNEILWEGLVSLTESGKVLASITEFDVRPTRPLDQTRIQELRMRLVKLSLKNDVPPSTLRALEWMSLARGARIKTEKFVLLWLALIALVKPGQRANELDPPRVEAYLKKISRPKGPLDATQTAALKTVLLDALKARNKLIHRDDVKRVTPLLLEDLETALFQMVDFELLPFRVSDIVV
jgi:hypothetical protein